MDEWNQHSLKSHYFTTFLDKTYTLIKTSCNTFRIPSNTLILSKIVQKDYYSLPDDIKQRVILFMVHWVNVLNQRKATKEIIYGIDCSTIVLLMDYKLKQNHNTIVKTSEYYGKIISWNGMLGYTKLPDGELKSIYFNHILTGDLKQDWISIL